MSSTPIPAGYHTVTPHLARHKEDVAPEQLQKRVQAMFPGKK